MNLRKTFGLGSVLGFLIAYAALRIAQENGWGIVAFIAKVYLIINLAFFIGITLLILVPLIIIFLSMRKLKTETSKYAGTGTIEAKFKVRKD